MFWLREKQRINFRSRASRIRGSRWGKWRHIQQAICGKTRICGRSQYLHLLSNFGGWRQPKIIQKGKYIIISSIEFIINFNFYLIRFRCHVWLFQTFIFAIWNFILTDINFEENFNLKLVLYWWIFPLQIGSRSSVYSPESRVRKTGSYIYEDFMPTDGTDVKVYTVGPDYAHAEARKSPALDGKVERDSEGKEIRYPVILSNAEKLISRKVCMAFKQTVCGFDLLRYWIKISL